MNVPRKNVTLRNLYIFQRDYDIFIIIYENDARQWLAVSIRHCRNLKRELYSYRVIFTVAISTRRDSFTIVKSQWHLRTLQREDRSQIRFHRSFFTVTINAVKSTYCFKMSIEDLPTHRCNILVEIFPINLIMAANTAVFFVATCTPFRIRFTTRPQDPTDIPSYPVFFRHYTEGPACVCEVSTVILKIKKNKNCATLC